MKIYVNAGGTDYNVDAVNKLKNDGYDVCCYAPAPAPVKTDPEAWKNITSLEAVYAHHGLPNGYIPDLSGFPEFMRSYKAAEFVVQLMAAAINGTWVADWSNTQQRKYYAWWNISGRGLALHGVLFGFVGGLTSVGPRLIFESEAKVRHAVKYFTPVFEDHYFTV